MAGRSQHFAASLKPTQQSMSKRANANSVTASTTPKSQSAPRLWKISAEAGFLKGALMKSQRDLQKISAGISLIILSLAFFLLGLLSFFSKPHTDLANVDNAFRLAGSSASLFAGTTFLVASCAYWRRYP
jgi:hypothetical protein